MAQTFRQNTSFLILASAARTTDGTQTFRVPKGTKVSIAVDATASTGTGETLDVTLEWSLDGGTTYVVADTSDAFTQITDTLVSRVKVFDIKGPDAQIRWTLGGTSPNFTFSVRGMRITDRE